MYKLILKFTLIGLVPYLLFKYAGDVIYYLLLLLLLLFFEGFLLMKVLNDKNDDTKDSKEKDGFAAIIFIALIIFCCYSFALDKSFQKFWFNISYLISFFLGIILSKDILKTKMNE